MSLRRVMACLGLCACFDAATALAQPFEQADQAVTMRYSFKSSALFSRLPDDPLLFPDRGGATGLWRFRVEPYVRLGDRHAFEFGFEQRVRAFSSTSEIGGADVLPASVSAPFRLRQLDWRIASGSNGEWRGEIDRAAAHLSVSGADVIIGRQAIGWGRGVLFSAVDIFSPFTPLEADREWRRGVDAVRVDRKLADRSSVDVVAAFGDTLDHSAFAARLRGYAGKADVEIVGGRRARDVFVGMTSSAAVGEIEVHGEVAVFHTPEVSGDAGVQGLVTKAVMGGSYRISLGTGLLVYAEYHYSGFGSPSAGGITSRLQSPAFQERYLRGDTQILGRHATVLLASYEVSPEIALAAEWLQSPIDGSGVIVPSTTLTFGDRWSLLLSGYLPYGREPAGTTLGSEFGAAPVAAFVQLRIYR